MPAVVVGAAIHSATAADAPIAAALVDAFQRARLSDGSNWVGALPAVERVHVVSAGQPEDFRTDVSWLYAWPSSVTNPSVRSLADRVSAELASVSARYEVSSRTPTPEEVQWWLTHTASQSDTFRVHSSWDWIEGYPVLKTGLMVGGVGLGLWLLSEWLE